jgi:citrate lyase subunit beta/citryl-CoA lyase
MRRDYALIRSWLFVPADSEHKLARGWQSGADALIVDLEDAVASENKVAARAVARIAIAAAMRGTTVVAIRVNALDTGLTFADLAETVSCRPDVYVLPKIMAPDDIRSVSRRIGELEAQHGFEVGGIRIVPIATEHPRAVRDIDALCRADPRTAAVMCGTEDLAAAIGARRIKDADGTMLDVFRVARALTLLAASAAELPAIDTPVVELDALDVVEKESAAAAAMGFAGKLAVHPAQIACINKGFMPSADEAEYARALLDATRGSAGAVRFRGKMIDAPHIRIARRVVALVDAHGSGT